jgi:hypothetical protein
MSQEALAEQIDRKQAEISRLESGGYSLGAQWYPVIAEVLGVDVGWLMGSGPDDPDVLRERDRLRDERLVRVAPPERTVRTKKERTRPAHGLSTKPEYLALVNARHRCNTPSNKDFARYGGRGVEYRFPADFGEAYRLLIEAIGPRPEGMTLDRIDNDGHYELGNLRWSSRSDQQRNRRRNSSNGALREPQKART